MTVAALIYRLGKLTLLLSTVDGLHYVTSKWITYLVYPCNIHMGRLGEGTQKGTVYTRLYLEKN